MRAAIIALALAAPVGTAQAHPMPHTTLVVQTEPGAVELVASIPVSELEASPDATPAAEAGGYVLRHATLTGADGRAWRPALRAVEPAKVDDHAVVSVRLGFTPPPGGSRQAASLRYDAVTHRIASHYVLVYHRTGAGLTPLVRLQAPAGSVRLP